MHRYERLRQRSLYSFIAFLGLSALLAVGAVLSGDFGPLELKVLLTTLTISGVSINCMGCAVALERRGRQGLPLAGITLALATGVLILLSIWAAPVRSIPYFKLTAIVAAFAIAATHASLLALAPLAPGQSWIRGLARGSILAVAAMTAVAIAAELDSLNYYKLLIVATILVALLTLTIPILSRIQSLRHRADRVMKLVHVRDDLYRHGDGTLYRLVPQAEAAPGESSTAGPSTPSH